MQTTCEYDKLQEKLYADDADCNSRWLATDTCQKNFVNGVEEIKQRTLRIHKKLKVHRKVMSVEAHFTVFKE
jgi:hypothetical protein